MTRRLCRTLVALRLCMVLMPVGTLAAQGGRREQARAALSTASALFRAMEMPFWLHRAEAMLA